MQLQKAQGQRKARLFGCFAVMVSAIVLSLFLSGCSSVNLNKDASFRTDWGATVQYKVNSDWEEKEGLSTDSYYSIDYSSKNGKDTLFIWMSNTESSTYKYSSRSTYSQWLEDNEKTYSQSAQEQADAYKQLSGSRASKDLTNPEAYPDYTGYTLNEAGTETVDGIEFRLYKMSYTRTYSDSQFAKMQENNPDKQIEQTEQITRYIAVVKNGVYDIEVMASNEAILKGVLDSMTISL